MVDLLEARRRILLNTPHLESISGATASFTTDMASKLKSCKIHFTPIQEGSGDPSPENVRPIHGWDGVTVTRCGKNIANLNSDHMLSYAWTIAFPNPFKRTGKYTISCQNQIKAGGQLGSFVFLGNAVTDNSGYGLTGWTFGGSVMNVTFNITEGALNNKYIVFRFNSKPTYNSISNAQIQIEEGLAATEYESYTEASLIIPFPQTIYGGYVDLVNGEVVEEWVNGTVPTNDVRGKQLTGYNRELSTERYFGISIASKGTSAAIICNMAIKGNCRADNQTTRIQPDGTALIHYALPNNVVGILSTDTPDERNSKIIDWLSNNQMTFVYDIKTPNTYPLDPVTIKTLRGVNNIWSDANGNIEIKFWTH